MRPPAGSVVPSDNGPTIEAPGRNRAYSNTTDPSVSERAEAEYSLGYQCRKKGDFKRAVEHYSNAIDANPSSFKAVFNRGFAYDKLEDFDSAIRDYTAATAIEPDNAFAYYNRGITYDR